MLIENINNYIPNEKQKMAQEEQFGQEYFLNMLVMQMRYQDLMSPEDTGDFTQQLALFNIMEQDVKTNESLKLMLELQRAHFENPTMQNTIGYIGTKVEADTGDITLVNGRAECAFTIPKEVSEVNLTISDLEGEEVFKSSEGTNRFIWNGKNNQGDFMDIGDYKVTLPTSDARSSETIVPCTLIGTVNSVKNVHGGPYLEVSGLMIGPKYILAVESN